MDLAEAVCREAERQIIAWGALYPDREQDGADHRKIRALLATAGANRDAAMGYQALKAERQLSTAQARIEKLEAVAQSARNWRDGEDVRDYEQELRDALAALDKPAQAASDPIGQALKALPVLGTLHSVGGPGSGQFTFSPSDKPTLADEPCPRCGGSGTKTCVFPGVRCPRCGGSGKERP